MARDDAPGADTSTGTGTAKEAREAAADVPDSIQDDAQLVGARASPPPPPLLLRRPQRG